MNKLRKISKRIFGIGALIFGLGLSSCSTEEPPYNVLVDLNGDKKQEIVSGNYTTTTTWDKERDYLLTSKSLDSGEIKLIKRFYGRPEKIEFRDIDGDGDLDLVLMEWGKAHGDYADYDILAAKNDGKGNFGEFELIDRQRR